MLKFYFVGTMGKSYKTFFLNIQRLGLFFIFRLNYNFCIWFLIKLFRLINFNNDIWTYSSCIVELSTSLKLMIIDDFSLVFNWFTCDCQVFLLFSTLRICVNVNDRSIFLIEWPHHFLCILLGLMPQLHSNLAWWLLKFNWIKNFLNLLVWRVIWTFRLTQVRFIFSH